MFMSVTPLSLGSDPSRAKRAEQAGPQEITHAPSYRDHSGPCGFQSPLVELSSWLFVALSYIGSFRVTVERETLSQGKEK